MTTGTLACLRRKWMGRFVQDSESHGSLRDLQILINEKSDLLDKEVSNILKKKYLYNMEITNKNWSICRI